MMLNSKRLSYKVSIVANNKFMFNVNVFVGVNEDTLDDVMDKVDEFLLYECPDFGPKLWANRGLCVHDIPDHVKMFEKIVTLEDRSKLSRFLID